MKKILLFVLISLISLSSMNVNAELNFGFDYDIEGWTPRWVYVEEDSLIGEMHYVGVSYFEKKGSAYEGPTVRYAVGKRGERLNLAFTSGFSFMAVDFGLTYTFLNTDNPRDYEDDLDGLALELGLRLWVVQIIAFHSDYSSYVSFGYGF